MGTRWEDPFEKGSSQTLSANLSGMARDEASAERSSCGAKLTSLIIC